MKIKITASNEEGCSVVEEHEVSQEGDVSKAVGVVVEAFRKKCGSAYDMSIKVEH